MSLTRVQIGVWDVQGIYQFIPAGGNHYWVDPVNGGDGNNGSKDTPVATLYKGLSLCTSGHNDVVHLIANGLTSGAARLSTALAQNVTSTATNGTLNWNLNATHLVGEAAPGCATCRARIAPAYSSGTTGITESTFGSVSFVNVTGLGCVFFNFEADEAFSTGAVGEICWTDAGRNTYIGVGFSGLMTSASAGDATGTSLLCTGNVGESAFYGCTIGVDSVTRGAANASLTFSGGSPRNKFVDCLFPFAASAGGVLGIIVPAIGIDRYAIFERCKFINAVLSGATTMTALTSVNAAPGGLILFKDCTLVGISGYGTTGTYIDGGAVSAHATISETGIAVTPFA